MIEKVIKNMSTDQMRDDVQDYYGRVLDTNKDLKTSACCESSSFPDYLKEIINNVHPEVLEKFYGCGSPLPLELKGKRVLDLGCGTGRDCYLASQLVGEGGEVVGIDMTDEQLDVANRHQDFHTNKFGFKKSNITFIKGFIEEMENLNLKDNYFDVVISNCVLNLSPQKDRVVEQVFRVLKPGGEFYFSDVYADRRLPEAFKEDKVLLGECLGGALYWNDFERIARKTGFADPRVYSNRVLDITNKEVAEKIGVTNFYSTGYRLFKIEGLEDACEDFGHQVKYLGTLDESPNAFFLDDHHIFQKNQIVPVCGNTYKMLHETRFKDHFVFKGDFSEHLGFFNCGPEASETSSEDCSGPGCC